MLATRSRSVVFGIALTALALVLGACGDDDSTLNPPVAATSTPTPPTNDAPQYNFGGIEGAVSAVQSTVANIQGLLDEGGQCVKTLAPIWGGSGSEAYLGTQQRWNSTAADLNAALQNLAQKIGDAGAGMQGTEGGVSGMFGYAFGGGATNISYEQTTDAEALLQAAAHFDQVSSNLKGAISSVDSQGSDLAGALSGPAGTAAQQAFIRFREAGDRQIQLLDEITQHINQAGVQYQNAHDDAQSSLGGSMGF